MKVVTTFTQREVVSFSSLNSPSQLCFKQNIKDDIPKPKQSSEFVKPFNLFQFKIHTVSHIDVPHQWRLPTVAHEYRVRRAEIASHSVAT